MKKYRLTESQLKRLAEVAMDLDIYSQKSNPSTGSINDDIENSTEQIIEKLQELLNDFQTGKKVSTSQKMQLHKILDDINQIYDSIKNI